MCKFAMCFAILKACATQKLSYLYKLILHYSCFFCKQNTRVNKSLPKMEKTGKFLKQKSVKKNFLNFGKIGY